MSPFRAIRFPCAVYVGMATCLAAAITDIQLTNNSTLLFVTEDSIRAREFRTQAFTPSAGTQVGDTVSFTNRLAWTSTQRVFPGPSSLPLTHGGTVAYDLTFTVEDPAMIGYTLSIESVIRGFVTALWQDNVGIFPSLVFSSGTLMAASLNDGSGFGRLLPDISTDTEVAMATPTDPFVNLPVSGSGSHHTGLYTGTRTFTLRYANLAANAGVGLQNYNIGEGNVRFGLDPSYGNFLNASYPGPDGEAADQHGHFLTVTANFQADPAPIPEPAPIQLLAVAAVVVTASRKFIHNPTVKN